MTLPNLLSKSSRREFCAATCRAASGLAGALMVAPCAALAAQAHLTPLASIRARVEGEFVVLPVEGTPLAKVGGVARVASNAGGFLVARPATDTFLALTGKCSHDECDITDLEGQVYFCACHGSKFELTGELIQGPAETGLDTFATTFQAGILKIAL